jgi:hypothetical protein
MAGQPTLLTILLLLCHTGVPGGMIKNHFFIKWSVPYTISSSLDIFFLQGNMEAPDAYI